MQGYLYQNNTFYYAKVHKLVILDRMGSGDEFATWYFRKVNCKRYR